MPKKASQNRFQRQDTTTAESPETAASDNANMDDGKSILVSMEELSDNERKHLKENGMRQTAGRERARISLSVLSNEHLSQPGSPSDVRKTLKTIQDIQQINKRNR